MIELNTSTMHAKLEATFENDQKFKRRSYIDDFEYFNGKRTSKDESGMPCVLKASRSRHLVNTEKWKADIEADKHILENSSSTQYFLKYYAFKNDGNQFSVVHEWFDTTLEQFMVSKGNRLSEDLAMSIYYQVVVAIGYMEEAGVIHRNINPNNIVLIFEGEEVKVKLFNYTLGLINTSGRDPVGSDPEYMAPSMIAISENRESNAEYGSCVDYWSATVMLYVMFFGRPPFELGNAEHSRFGCVVKYSGQQLKIPLKHSVSESAINLLKRILDPDKCTLLDRDTILDDPMFSKFGTAYNNHLTQSVINQVENTSIMFRSLRMSQIPDMSQFCSVRNEKDFSNRVNKLINDRKQRIIFINGGLELVSRYLDAFRGEENKALYKRHLLTAVALIIVLRGNILIKYRNYVLYS
jgi:serine/threonine protein kinase